MRPIINRIVVTAVIILVGGDADADLDDFAVVVTGNDIQIMM